MISLTVQQRRALRYAVMKANRDREVRNDEQSKPVTSSTPALQSFFESARGQTLMLLVGLAIFVLMAPVGSL